jgi:hypothetical protein
MAESSEKKCSKYACEFCDYYTSKKSSYKSHVLTAKHKNQQIQQNQQKNNALFYCEICDYTTDKKCNYDSHILTAKHKIQQTSKKNMPSFYCEICEYITDKKCNYESHILTAKHKKQQNQREIMPTFCCDECDYETYNKTNYESHMLTCSFKNIQEFVQPPSIDKELILSLIKNNSEVMNALVQFTQQSQNHQSALLEVIKNGTHNNIMTNSNNKTFNIQVFLNETCKNAMNFSDFVQGIQTDLNDVEYVGKNGYVNGISNILIRNIQNMKVEERPLHCTDEKRETIYIKENDKWEIEDLSLDDNKMLQLVRDVSLMNAKNVHKWRDIYPQCLLPYSDKTDQYNYIVHEALGGDTKYTTKQKEEKIISKILKSIKIDKQKNLC